MSNVISKVQFRANVFMEATVSADGVLSFQLTVNEGPMMVVALSETQAQLLVAMKEKDGWDRESERVFRSLTPDTL
jgi:hypothetical protein